jgi:nicotinamide riboside kinase
MAKIIAVTGPESTGKSWLSAELAKHFEGTFVPEYARSYFSNRLLSYTIEDVLHIAEQQERLINNAKDCSKSFVIADTEILVCYIWSEFVFGYVPDTLKMMLERQQIDLYLLCYPDLPWEPDPLREHPQQRLILFEMYEKMLLQLGWPFEIVTGTGQDRLELAVKAVTANIG